MPPYAQPSLLDLVYPLLIRDLTRPDVADQLGVRDGVTGRLRRFSAIGLRLGGGKRRIFLIWVALFPRTSYPRRSSSVTASLPSLSKSSGRSGASALRLGRLSRFVAIPSTMGSATLYRNAVNLLWKSKLRPTQLLAPEARRGDLTRDISLD